MYYCSGCALIVMRETTQKPQTRFFERSQCPDFRRKPNEQDQQINSLKAKMKTNSRLVDVESVIHNPTELAHVLAKQRAHN